MKKLLTILGMVFLAATFMAPDTAQAQTPNLSSPPNGYQATVNSTGSITFKWVDTYQTWSRNFHLQVDNNSNFSSPEYSSTTGKVTSKKVTGLSPGVTYYWRVKCEYLYIFSWVWSNWSGARNFKIVIPELLSPASGVTDQVQPLNLTWRAIANPLIFNVGHQLWVDNNSDFSSPEININTKGSSRSVSGLDYNTKFYWKVRYYFYNVLPPYNYTYYNWSLTRNFTTGCDIPTTPTLSSPPNNAIDQLQPVALDWSTITIAEDYKIQIATNTGFSPTVVDEYVGASSYQAGGLDDGTKYYWRVAARNECGSSSLTGYRNFTTICPEPDPPGLVLPADGAPNMSMPFTLDWNDVATADWYRVAVDDNDNFSSPEIDEQPSSSQYQVTSGLTDGVKYYWRVMVHDHCGNSVWSPRRSFTMECPTPGVPTLELPPNGVTDVSQPVTWDWSDVSGASKYHIQVDDDPAFGSLIVNNSNRIASDYTWGGLEDATQYYWRVRAGNDCGSWSGWSGVRDFTTECVVLGPPTLSGPPDEEGLDVRVPVVLTWGDVAGATDYDVRVSDDEMFNNIIAENIHASSGYTIEYPLQAGTWYYWEVRTNNACGDGDWSDTWEFQPNCPTAGVPTLESPLNGALSVMQPIELDWTDVAEATKYNVQVDNNADFGSMDVNDENVAVSALTLPNLLEGISYHWRIRAYNGCQWGEWSTVWNFIAGEQTDVKIVARDEIPESFTLKQNYPNPFNPATTIEFALPRAAYVTLDIHNILGGKVETLVSRPMSAGSYSVIWDASNAPSGVYFYKIEAGTFSETKKMTLVK